MTLMNKVFFVLFACAICYEMYLMLFKEPREARKKAAALLARAKAQHEGVEKMCDADKKLRALMERKGPLSPQDQELKMILKEHTEGEKIFRENSDPPAEEKK